ncbi:MAG TPA: WD40 repeat domain-containing protein, partial [Streptosporangiaceae bacterium]|nr:WD40 repeat domain-containing protein [Streptosporangiaceae bacterium]
MRVLRRGAGRRPTTVASDPENLEDPGHRLARAVSAGPDVFARLLAEPGFLASASPEMLGPLLWAAGPQAYDAVRVYRRVRPLLGPDVSANAAYLNEAAQALTGAPLAAGPGIRPVYRTRLTSVRRDDALLRWTGHAALAGAAALGTVTGNGEAGGGRLLLASCSDDNTVRLWNPLTGTALGDPLTCHTGHVYWVAFGTFPDGRLLLASCGADRTVRLWDPLAGAPFGEPLTGHTGAVNMVAFGTVTGDGEAGGGRLLLASCSDDNTVRLWDPLTCEPLGGPLKGHTDRAWELTFSTAADHRLLLVSSGFDRTIRFWDPLTQSELGDPLEQPPSMLASGTTPDGRPLLATGNQQGAVRVWDPLSRTLVCEPLTGHPRKVGGVAFGTTPDGQFVLAASTQDDSVRLWEPLTGTPVGEPLYGHTGYGFS